MQQPIPTKPSFLQSVFKGIEGYIKGMIAGGAVGALGGLVVGSIFALISVAASAPIAGGVAMFLAMSTLLGGALFGSIGAISGAMTEVVKSREVGQVSAADVVGLTKVSYVQGVYTGQQMAQQQSNYRERIDAERAAAETTQRVH